MPKKKIVIDGIIGWDIYGSSMRRMLKEADGEELEIEIASPGGFVYDGLEIFNLIRDYSRNQAKVTIKLMGLAASMASYIALAGDKLIAEDNAVFMIHNVWTVAIGDYKDLEKTAKEIEGLSNLLAKQYAKKSGKKISEIRDLMDDETFFFGEEAKEAGFVDEIVKSKNDDNDIVTIEDKEDSIIEARARVNYMQEQMQKSEKSKKDLEKAAAMIPIETKTINSVKNKEPKKELTMTLQEFLSQNPEAKTEYETNILASKKDGEKETLQNYKKNIDSVKNYLNSSEYPQKIKDIAIAVITGDKTVEAFKDLISVFDMLNEKNKSDAAKDDTNNIPDTPPINPDLPNESGEATTEHEFRALIARKKKGENNK